MPGTGVGASGSERSLSDLAAPCLPRLLPRQANAGAGDVVPVLAPVVWWGIIVHMSSVVNLTCRGTAMHTHKLRTVAQFRYDDAWARVHTDSRQDDLIWEPTGELRIRHRISCDLCRPRRQDEQLRPETLYPLDWARENGKDEVPLG